ncbi:hypothetical protein EV144_103552 [Flavobacterium sp. 270]|nr:hypothetical protein EV144_103552 [Flavobacterium sp. 270]
MYYIPLFLLTPVIAKDFSYIYALKSKHDNIKNYF